MSEQTILSVRDIQVHFNVKAKSKLPWAPSRTLKAVDGVSVALRKGETLGVVGESGSGKTTLGLALLRLIPSTGTISFDGRAIEGLGRSGDERAFPLIRGAWRAAAPFPARRAVVAALAELGRGTGLARAAREAIEERLRDGDFRVRLEAALALGRLGLVEAVPAIRAALAGELDGRTKRRMNEAIRDIEDGARPAEEARRLHEEVERLRGETARLRERMDRLETRLGPPPAQSPPPAKTKRPRPIARRRSRGRPPRRR